MTRDILGQDIRYTLRTLRRAPGFTLTALAVAAIGIGATTAAFTVTDHVLLRPLPFLDADRLVKGVLIGLAESFSTGYVGGQWSELVVFGLLIGFLIVRPTGLLGSHAIQKV